MVEDERERRNLVGNEQIKLSATYTNGIAITVFAFGGFGLLVSMLFSPTPSPFTRAAIGFSVICQAASLILHFTARRFLRKLVR